MMPRPKKMKRSYILNNYINNSIPSEHVPGRQIHALETKTHFMEDEANTGILHNVAT